MSDSRTSLITLAACLAVVGACHAQQATGARPASSAPSQAAPQATPAPAAERPSSPSAATKDKAQTPKSNATIGTITELARELKVEQLRKDLREARKETGGASPAVPPSTASVLAAQRELLASNPRPGAAPATQQRAAPRVLDAPPVVAIVGVGGQLRARLPDGSDVVVGQTLYRPEAQATVKLITQTAVTWEVCDRSAPPPAAPATTRGAKAAPAAPEQPRCFRRTSSPTGA